MPPGVPESGAEVGAWGAGVVLLLLAVPVPPPHAARKPTSGMTAAAAATRRWRRYATPGRKGVRT